MLLPVMQMDLPDSRVVFSQQEIAEAIDRLATEVVSRCGNEEWLAVCVMNGGLMFTAQLMLRLPVKMKQDFVRVTRYHESTTGGQIQWVVHPESDLSGRKILLIDDIFDEGDTLVAISRKFLEEGASEVVSVVLVEKEHDRKSSDYRPDHVGFTCRDQYVFGFGMDVEGYWRNLPEIRELVR